MLPFYPSSRLARPAQLRRPTVRRCCVHLRRARATAPVAGPSTSQDDNRARRFKAEFLMMSSRLGGVIQQAVTAAVLGARDRVGGRAPAREVVAAEAVGGLPGPDVRPARDDRMTAGAAATATTTPAGMTSAFLRCVEAQLQARKYMSGGDEAGDVLAGFPSASLFYYPGGGLQGVVEHAAVAAAQARGPAAPAAAAVLRSLAGAVGRLAAQPKAEAARGKAAAVMTCLDGMAEALEGAARGGEEDSGTAGGARPATATAAVGLPATDLEGSAALLGLEAGQLLREVAAVLDCIAGGSPGLPASHAESATGHILTPSTPAHPLLSALETRLYSDTIWRSDSASEISSGLVDYVASLLAPSRFGNTSFSAGPMARGSACAALHSLARAQSALAAALKEHGAEPAAASRLLGGLAEALAVACITRDAAPPSRGPHPRVMFGEAQLLAGLSRMAAGEALTEALTPGGAATAASVAAAAVAADAAAGDSSLDRSLGVSDSSLVLEVLAAQARQVAASHCDHIAQVLQDLRDLPGGLGPLSQLPPAVGTAASAAQELLSRVAGSAGAAAGAEAAAAVAADNAAAAAEAAAAAAVATRGWGVPVAPPPETSHRSSSYSF